MDAQKIATRNLNCFTCFRAFFSARFYYPIYALLFLDFGLTLEQFGILNGVWALTIVLSEVPSGALADTIGRRNLLLIAGFFMVIEMSVLLLAPLDASPIVFYLFLINRIISGLAEAAASGADEALAYDSLKAAGRETEWRLIIEKVQRMTSIAFFFALTIGAVVYDPQLTNALMEILGLDLSFTQKQFIKLPLFLTFLSGLIVFYSAWRMHEVKKPRQQIWNTYKKSGQQIFDAGRWILITPLACGVVFAVMVLDSVIRQYLTLASEYWKTIDLPIATFGLIGSGTALLGILTPRIARYLADHFSPFKNLIITSAIVVIGLYGLAAVIPIWGIAPAVLLHVAMHFMNYFGSRYLNEIAASEQRATILSFKGLATNIAYGMTAILYSVLFASIRARTDPSAFETATAVEESIFIESLAWLPTYFLLMLGLLIAGLTFRFSFKKGT
jgi:MFS family permease